MISDSGNHATDFDEEQVFLLERVLPEYVTTTSSVLKECLTIFGLDHEGENISNVTLPLSSAQTENLKGVFTRNKHKITRAVSHET